VFHDLRHTAKTYLRKAGVDRNIRMVIFGHTDGNDMDSHYDTMDEGDLIDAIDRVELYLRKIEYQKNSHY
jgi:integrase